MITYYVFLDEIQFVKDVPNPYLEENTIGFVDAILGLMKIKNVDLYVTGSNSEMLSNQILTKFRGKGDQIHVILFHIKNFTNLIKEIKLELGMNTLHTGECLLLH